MPRRSRAARPRHDRRAGGGARGRRARRGADRDPLGARRRCAPASSAPAARAAIAVRTMPTVFELLQTGGTAHAPAARGADRGRPGPRAGEDGGRVRRRLPDRPARAGHRRRRLDRLRALPPDRAREPEPARAARQRRGQPVRDRARARRRAPRRLPRSPCSPTARTRSGCARSSPSTAPRSSSTRRPTSTSALMENNPIEAVRNNALATRAADDDRRRVRARARSCSSRPTRRSRPPTVMGASKALAEWAVEAADARYPRTRRSAPCASATCSAPRARSCRSSAARSPRAAP